jgi:hypothetical protein
MVIYTDTPIASHTLAQDQPIIEGNFIYLANTLGTSNANKGDHQISLTGNDATAFEGRHLQVCLNNRHSLPPTVAGINDSVDSLIYSDDGNLFFGTSIGAGAYQLTSADTSFDQTLFGAYATIPTAGLQTINGAGWSFLAGGLIMQYGFILTPGAVGSAKFPVKFINNVIGVFFNYARGGGAHSADDFWIDSGGTNNKSTFSYRGSTTTADYLYFYAIGN